MANPHFFKPLLPGFNTHISIPAAFYSKHLKGREEGNAAKLRSDASEITWNVEMDGKRLTQGWEKFAVAHGLKVGDFLVFEYQGNLLFHLTHFGPSCCEIIYSESENGTREVMSNKKVKRNPIQDTNCIVPVTASNLKLDSCHLPKGFTTSIGVPELSNEIILMDEKGRSSTLALRYDRYSKRFRFGQGWRAFCCMNGHKTGDLLRLSLVQNGKTPILRVLPVESDGKQSKKNIPEESTKGQTKVESLSCAHNSSFVVSVTVSNLVEDRLILPMWFSRPDVLNQSFHKINLMSKQGRTWTLSLRFSKSSGRYYITDGWKSFCEANCKKAGCSFVFQLVRNRTSPVLLMTSEDRTIQHISQNEM